MDTDKLKTLALAAEEGGDIFVMMGKVQAFQWEATPAAVLELIAEVERLREGMEIAVRGLQNIAAVEARAAPEARDQNSTKTPETRMDAAFEGGPSGTAPAAGTEKDSERLDFVIAEECQIEHMDRPGATPLYRVRWPWEVKQMRAWSASGREAIDAAIAAKEPPCGP